jgi:hypothetical protein
MHNAKSFGSLLPTAMAVTISQPVAAGSTPSPYQIDVDQVRAISSVIDITR